jgi:hypothetical protein
LTRLFLIASVALALAPPASSCGSERWPVKTLTEPDAGSVDFSHPHRATVAALGALPVQAGGQDSRSLTERRVYSVGATLLKAKREEDGDYHLVLRDGRASMIAESPDSACTRGAQHRFAMFRARRKLDAVLGQLNSHWRYVGLRVRIVGVLFFDRPHGQRGHAPNYAELHPITALSFKPVR